MEQKNIINQNLSRNYYFELIKFVVTSETTPISFWAVFSLQRSNALLILLDCYLLQKLGA